MYKVSKRHNNPNLLLKKSRPLTLAHLHESGPHDFDSVNTCQLHAHVEIN